MPRRATTNLNACPFCKVWSPGYRIVRSFSPLLWNPSQLSQKVCARTSNDATSRRILRRYRTGQSLVYTPSSSPQCSPLFLLKNWQPVDATIDPFTSLSIFGRNYCENYFTPFTSADPANNFGAILNFPLPSAVVTSLGSA